MESFCNYKFTNVNYSQFISLPEYNYALSKEASQSSTYTNDDQYLSQNAVDGLQNTLSITNFASNQWWKIDIQDRILFSYVQVYVRDGRCQQNTIDCCKQYHTLIH